MSRVCRACSRVNSPEASFCYFDGTWLGPVGDSAGPLAIGGMPFPAPFVFASGRVCRCFDELALGCEAEWPEARELLRSGFFAGFFAALGRADLGQAARRAQGAQDPDRALDQFLGQLPGNARQSPNLVVQPREVNLGQLTPGQSPRISLRLENGGMGLLYGSVAVEDADWLLLGEGAGSPRKVFQCRHGLVLPVQVSGKLFRAAQRPFEAHILIESNGGVTNAVIRAEVPIRPFPSGVLAGATSPRQVAERAKASPNESAYLFESGAVAAWYRANGWDYPVQGPAASGIGAVQQFFEALGLARPPRVEINCRSLKLTGSPGATLDEVIHVRTVEKRPVFAHARSDVPWLKVRRVHLDGRTAYIAVQVPMVPVHPGATLYGTVYVTANGNQRFAVDATLTIEGAPAADWSANPVGPADADHKVGQRHNGKNSEQHAAAADLANTDYEISNHPIAGLLRFCLHIFPLLALLLGLAGTLAHDFHLPTPEAMVVPVDPTSYLAVRFHDGADGEKILPPRTMRFGLYMPKARDPDDRRHYKLLTFDERGRTNNTCLRVDGADFLFGEPPGKWIERSIPLAADATGRERDGGLSIWELPESRLRVTQRVEIVAGESSNRLDTCQVRYVLENLDSRSHNAGLRFLLDTFIGANDGVPFLVPGSSGLCDSMMDLGGTTPVPDFIEAQEYDDLTKPGTVAHLQFRLGGNIEVPRRVTLGGWPNSSFRFFGYPEAAGERTLWSVPLLRIDELQRLARRVGKQAAADSAVTMYWPEKTLAPRSKREVGFSYGLGEVASAEGGGRLLLSVGGPLVRDGVFTLTALVRNPRQGERLMLVLPSGFSLVEGGQEQTVPAVGSDAARPISPVTWQIRAGKAGRFTLQVQSSAGPSQKQTLSVRSQGIFD